MSEDLKAGDLIDSFSRAARGDMPVLEVIGIAETYCRTDRKIAASLYAAWLAAAQAPMAGAVWYNFAVVLESLGEIQRAIAAFRQAIALMPSLRSARHGLLRALLQDSKRFMMKDGGPDEAYLVCRDLLGKGALSARRSRAESQELGLTMAYYAFLHESMQFVARGEYLYEIFFAEGGVSEYFQERFDNLTRARAELRRPSPTSDLRLRCVNLEIVDGNTPSARMMSPETVEACLGNLDVNVISTLRLFAAGEPLLHARPLNVLNAVIGFRRSGVRADMVEIWTDGHDVDMVMLEELLRCVCLDGIIVRCAGDATAAGYRPPRHSADFRDLLQFFDKVTRYRDLYDLDLSLRAWIKVEGEEQRQRWRDLLAPRGWIADFADSADASPPLHDGLPPSLAEGDGLTIAVDGSIGAGETLLRSTYSEILTGRAKSSRKLA